MRGVLLAGLIATSALVQSGRLGVFTGSDDVGAPPLKGSAEFDATTRQYKITGSGADIWGRADQFHYVWREISGNFAVTATTTFLTDGIAHRKAVIMLRKSLDTDSHGVGRERRCAPQRTGPHHQPAGEPDPGRSRGELAHAGSDQHGAVLGRFGRTAASETALSGFRGHR